MLQKYEVHGEIANYPYPFIFSMKKLTMHYV
jgi:hypothetical protein